MTYTGVNPDFLGILALAFLALSFFFSMAEGALLAFSPARLLELFGADKEDQVNRYAAQRDAMVISTIGIDLTSNTSFVTCLTLWITDHAGWASLGGILLSIACSILVLLPLGEILPRSWGHKYSSAFLIRTLPFLSVTTRLMSPVLVCCHAANRAMLRLLGQTEPDRTAQIADELQAIVTQGEQQGVIEESAKEMIESIIDFRHVDVNEIKTPRTAMVCISAESTLEEAVRLVVSDQHSRIPVFEGTRDNIVGVLYAKDLFPHWNKSGIKARDIMRKALFIPETKPALDLLREMRSHQTQLAVILDEYGGTDGIITIEDLLEEIVGDIEDEYDAGAKHGPFKKIDDDTAEVDAALSVDELAEQLTVTLPENEHYETLGGFLFNEMGRIPAAGEEYAFANLRFRVLEATDRKISRVRVSVNRQGSAAE